MNDIIFPARDADGRLIALAFDSVPPPAADDNPWLVAVDGSKHALRATAAASRLAASPHSCNLHLINVQHWLAKEAAESELARRGWDATLDARALLDAAGQPWRLHVTMGEAADCIAALATRLECQGIVVGSHGLNAVKAMLLGSVTQRLLQIATVPVMVVR